MDIGYTNIMWSAIFWIYPKRTTSNRNLICWSKVNQHQILSLFKHSRPFSPGPGIWARAGPYLCNLSPTYAIQLIPTLRPKPALILNTNSNSFLFVWIHTWTCLYFDIEIMSSGRISPRYSQGIHRVKMSRSEMIVAIFDKYAKIWF